MASEKQSQKSKSSEITMEQRLKNRERQRRFRERKRQAANARKAMEAKELTPQSPPAPSLPANAAVVPPRRNWKKEARMAHLNMKDHEIVLGLRAHQASGSEASVGAQGLGGELSNPITSQGLEGGCKNS